MEQDLKQAIAVLKKGGVILYPTDTIWGIGCDATNSEAVKRVFEIKKRADSKSLIVLADSVAAVERIVGRELPDAAYQLLDVAVDPLTIVYDDVAGVAPEVRAEDGSVGIRITEEKFSQALCRRLGRALVSTSANISGKKAPAMFADIDEELKKAVDYVVEFGRDDRTPHKASSVIKVGNDNTINIIRN